MFSEEAKETAKFYLLEDSLSHIDMLEALRRGSTDIIYAASDGVVLYEKESETCMISLKEINRFHEVINPKKYSSFAVHQKKIAEWIQDKYHLPYHFEAYQAAYRRKEAKEGIFDFIKELSEVHTQIIASHYTATEDIGYIKKLLERKQLWGLFEHGDLVGFIGEHLEGSMGLLEIFPPFRKKGHGYTLEAFLINRFLRLDRVPFCQVEKNNASSFSLQKKLGMEISKEATWWLFQ